MSRAKTHRHPQGNSSLRKADLACHPHVRLLKSLYFRAFRCVQPMIVSSALSRSDPCIHLTVSSSMMIVRHATRMLAVAVHLCARVGCSVNRSTRRTCLNHKLSERCVDSQETYHGRHRGKEDKPESVQTAL
jgi:hypothetical protein